MKHSPDKNTRQRILDAALRLFARRGFAGTSVQEIVDGAAVTKPVLYYYFESKTALYQALVDTAYDERLRIMQEAAARGRNLETRLVEITAALFSFLEGHRDLIGVAFNTTFAPREEMPREIKFLEKSRRNFDFVQDLIRAGQAEGDLCQSFDSEELTRGLWGMMCIYVMGELLTPGLGLGRERATSVIRLFLQGSAVQKRTARNRIVA